MSLLALVIALALEQLQPPRADDAVRRGIGRLVDGIGRRAGQVAAEDGRVGIAGALAWLLLVAGLCGGLWLLDLLLADLFLPLSLALHVAVLYRTTGFRHFSRAYLGYERAMQVDDAVAARTVLEAWMRRSDPGFTAAALDGPAMNRLAMALALLAAHRGVFGPLLAYALLPGPTGPLLYRLAGRLAHDWPRQAGPAFGRFALRALAVIDWLPLRASAATFAVVGNFEDALYCWRGAAQAGSAMGDDPLQRQRAMILGVGGGALGVRLADPAIEQRWQADGEGFEWDAPLPDVAALRRAVDMAWRALVLWVGLFALVELVGWSR